MWMVSKVRECGELIVCLWVSGTLSHRLCILASLVLTACIVYTATHPAHDVAATVWLGILSMACIPGTGFLWNEAEHYRLDPMMLNLRVQVTAFVSFGRFLFALFVFAPILDDGSISLLVNGINIVCNLCFIPIAVYCVFGYVPGYLQSRADGTEHEFLVLMRSLPTWAQRRMASYMHAEHG